MTKKLFSKALALLAAVCITAGCDGGAATETATSAGTAVTEQTSTSNQQEISPEISELEALEVDYVDEAGTIYYKNPIEWTYDMVYEGLLIEGNKVESPLVFEKLGEKYSLYEDTLTYFEEDKQINAGIVYEGNRFGSIVLSECNNISDKKNKEITLIYLNNMFNENQWNCPNITVNEMGIGSTRNEIITALGTPCCEVYDDDKIYSIIYKFEGINTLTFILDNNKTMSFYIALNN